MIKILIKQKPNVEFKFIILENLHVSGFVLKKEKNNIENTCSICCIRMNYEPNLASSSCLNEEKKFR